MKKRNEIIEDLALLNGGTQEAFAAAAGALDFLDLAVGHEVERLAQAKSGNHVPNSDNILSQTPSEKKKNSYSPKDI